MPQEPRVSIVIPTYNSVAYLAATIDSVLAQTFADWELVLIDDGSSDGTVELAEDLARQDRRIRIVQGDHSGTAAARNAGFRETHPYSEFVVFLDSDDTWEPKALDLLVNALDLHSEYPAAHGLARSIDPHGKQVEGDDLTDVMRYRREMRGKEYVDLPVSAPTSFEAELVLNYVMTPGTSLMRRHVFQSLGGFEPEAVPAEDWDMNLRVARRGGFALVDAVVLNWRRHPQSASNTSRRNRRARLVVWRRTIQSRENAPGQRRAAWLALRREFHSLATSVRKSLMRRQVGIAIKTLILLSLYLWLMARLALERQPNRWSVDTNAGLSEGSSGSQAKS